MGCGCKKGKKKVVALGASNPAVYTTVVAPMMVQARCLNCVGLLKTDTDSYLEMQTGEFYSVSADDVLRWRAQGWIFEVRA